METTQLDRERQILAKKYARIHRSLMLVDLAITALYALLWLLTGWSAALRDWIASFTSNPWLAVPIFAVIFGGIYLLINLPLSYYSGFVLPHRYGQSNQTLRGWITDQIKSAAVGGVLGLLMLEAVYFVLRVAPDTWWIWAAVLMLFFSVVVSILTPILLFPIFYKFSPLGIEHQELTDRLVRLFERAGTTIKGVYRFDMSTRTKSANAALTGLGSTRRIILGDTLLENFASDEIETVLAHELGHHVNRDIPLSIAYETISTVLGLFLASIALRWGVSQFGFVGVADPAALPHFLLVMMLYGLITMPLSNGFSRWREVLADRYALEATRNGPAFASAMTRLANQNLAEVDPEPWVEFLLYSHPALEKRIRMAEQFQPTKK